MIKRMTVIARREALGREAFRNHWKSEHAALVRALPGVRKYVQNLFEDEETVTAAGATRFADGIGEIWFDSAEAMQAALATELWRAVVADMQSMSDQFFGFLVEENSVIG